MKLNPTLKNALVRTGCIVGSLYGYIILMRRIDYMEIMDDYDRYFIFCNIARFVVPLLIVWLNVRKLAKPIRLGLMALFVIFYARVVFGQRIEPEALNGFFLSLEIVGFVFIALASLLPIWLKNKQAERLAVYSKVAVWIAVPWLAFAVAFPEIKFDDFSTQGAYTGIITMKNGRLYLADKDVSDAMVDRKPYQQQVFAFVSNCGRSGYNGVYQTVQVMIPTDSTCREYRSRAYRHYINEDFMVHTSERDTIWLNEERIYIPNRNRMTNIELIQLRQQWQYDMWHRLKRFVHLFTDKKQHSENLRHGIKYDPVEDTLKYKAIEKQVEREIQEALKDESRGLGFCHRYWAVKQEILIRHGIEWRSPAEMNPDIMFD